tara:strand:- start:2 stop:292 length:291 start_codon:yes stop_codon:yes gene_type:complete
MAVTLIYTWDMKKMVAQQIVDIKNSPTTDHGSQVKSDMLDTDMFTVQIDKRTKVMKLFHNQNELLSVTHDDKTYVERLFNTLLNTVKQKMRFWSTN